MFMNRKFKLRQFGVGRRRTLFSFHAVIFAIAMMVMASTYVSEYI